MDVTPDLGVPEAIGLAAAFLFGGIIKGAMGFGLPLVTISILPNFLPIELALAINAATMVFTNLVQFLQAGFVTQTFTRFWPMIVGISAGALGGAVLVRSADEVALGLALGLLVMAFAVMTVYVPRFHIPSTWERPLGWGVGTIAGIVGGLITANGPLFVMYLVGLNLTRELFIATLALLFLATGILVAGSYWALDILDTTRFLIAVACLVPALIGMKIGDVLSTRLSAETFRNLVLAGLFLLGANMVRRALLAG
jgi:uncharacterized membrane protein YfcA